MEKEKEVPYFVLEMMMSRVERIIKIFVIVVVLLVIVLFASNGAWLYAWMQYDYSGEEIVTVDGKSENANYIGNDGEIVNGEDSGSETQKETEEERQVKGDEEKAE